MVSNIDQYAIDRIREMRKERKWSQLALANELGMSAGFIGKVESPKYKSHYNLNHLNRLSQIFHCSPKDFLPDVPL